MALVVEDGSGMDDAESYASLVDISEYLEAYGLNTEWDELDEPTQEVKARVATQFIDALFAGRWKGTKKTAEQALAWPRINVWDLDGYSIASDSIPSALKFAVAEMTRHAALSSTGVLYPVIVSGSNIKRKLVEVGPIKTDIEYFASRTTVDEYPLVLRLLFNLLTSVGTGMAVGRADRG